MRVIMLTLLQVVALTAPRPRPKQVTLTDRRMHPFAVIVTGVDWPGRPPMVPGHVWNETAPALKEVLEADKRYTRP